MDGLALNIAKYVVNKALYSISCFVHGNMSVLLPKEVEVFGISCHGMCNFHDDLKRILWLKRSHMLSPSRLDGQLCGGLGAQLLGTTAPYHVKLCFVDDMMSVL
jgi:hypothetical protein